MLAARPDKNGLELSAALGCLGAFCDGVVAIRRTQPDHPALTLLEPINGVISCVMAAQFPLGDVQWEEVAMARDWLSGVVDSGHLG